MVARDFIRGNQLLRSHKLEEAIAAYRKAIAHHPSFHWYHYKLGEALEQLGCGKEAELCYRQAIELNSNCVWSHYKLGMALVESGQIETGIEVLNAGLKLNPSDYQYYQYLAKILAKQGERQQAIAHYKKAI